MQNVQVLLQPTETETHAENADKRRAGNVDGKCVVRKMVHGPGNLTDHGFLCDA